MQKTQIPIGLKRPQRRTVTKLVKETEKHGGTITKFRKRKNGVLEIHVTLP